MTCSGCGAAKRKNGKALLRCGKCKTAQYCSKECQMDMWPAHKAECALKQLDKAKKRPDEGALRQRRSIQQNSGSGMNALFERLQRQFDARNEAIRDFVHPARAASARAGLVHNDFFDLEAAMRGEHFPGPLAAEDPEHSGFWVYWPDDWAKTPGAMAEWCLEEFNEFGAFHSEEETEREFYGGDREEWNPLDGPGWPGIYTDRRSQGIHLAPDKYVTRCDTWEEAWKLWHRTGGAHSRDGSRASGRPYRAASPGRSLRPSWTGSCATRGWGMRCGAGTAWARSRSTTNCNTRTVGGGTLTWRGPTTWDRRATTWS